MRLFADNATSTLASAIDASQTTITLATGEGAKFPSPTSGDFFDLTLTQADSETSWEIVRCTGRSGDSLTVLRGQYGTTGANWASGSKVELRVHAGVMEDCGKNNEVQSWVAQGQQVGTTSNGGVTIASGTITLNLGAFNSFDLGVLAAGAYTLENPSGLAANVSYKGDIKYTTPSTGAVTFSYGSGWDFDGATPSAPTANNATVFFDYASHSATNVRLTAPKAWS